MKTLKILPALLILLFSLGLSNALHAQTKYQSYAFKLTVTGTSTLHDWEMTSNKGQVDAIISLEDNKPAITGLSFTVPAQSLKSGHDLMDKNTYKALNVEKNPVITFVLSSADLVPSGNNTYQFRGVGKLTINGKSTQTDLHAVVKFNPAEGSFTCSGTKKFKMTDYGVKPPTVMMGTIKTGDDIAISYNLTIKS